MPHADKNADHRQEERRPAVWGGGGAPQVIDASPRIVAQRQQIARAFGPAHTHQGQAGAAPVQRKPVPKLTDAGGIVWYDDQDPLGTEYGSEAECRANNPQLPFAPTMPFLPGADQPVRIFDIRGSQTGAIMAGVEARRRERDEQQRARENRLRERFRSEFKRNPRLQAVALRTLSLLDDLEEAERVTSALIEHDLYEAAEHERLLRLVIAGRADALQRLLSSLGHHYLLLSSLLEHGWTFQQVSTLAQAGWKRELWELAIAYQDNRGGRDIALWTRLACAHPAFVNQPAAVAAFARIAGWQPDPLVALAALFGAGPGACTAAQWGQIAGAHAMLLDQPASVAAFARIAGWTPAHLLTLAGLFGADAGVCDAAQWGQIAIADANLHDHPATVASFARLAGWQPNQLVALGALFGAGPGVCTAAEWGQIAMAQAKLIDQPGWVAAFARIAGWAPAHLLTLAGLFGADAGACNAAQWGQIAIADANLHDDEAAVATFARIAGWTPASLATLAGLYGNNPGVCDLEQWVTLAELGAANQHGDVAALARIAGWGFPAIRMLARALSNDFAGGHGAADLATLAARVAVNAHGDALAFAQVQGWNVLNLGNLAATFVLGAGGKSARDWALIARAHANLVDQEGDVACFARVAGWSVPDLVALATGFALVPGPCNAIAWAQIAAAYAGSPAQCGAVMEFARMAGWTPPHRAALAQLFGLGAGVCTAAQWALLATADANLHDQPADVAEFARMLNWAPAHLVALAGLFGSDPGFCSAAQWHQIALAHANLYDHEADVAEFARIAGWLPANLAALAGLFGADAGGHTAAEWAQVASAQPTLANFELRAAGYARIALGTPADIAAFLGAHGPLVATNAGLTLVELLAQRPGASWVLLPTVVANLPPLFTFTRKLALVRDELPLLTVPQLIERLTVHGLPTVGGVVGGALLADDAMIGQMHADMAALNQSMNQRNIPPLIQQEVRIAFQLRNWRANQLTGFFGAQAVRGALAQPMASNPAHWLYLFALHHRTGALPAGGVAAGLPANNAYGGTMGNIRITQASIDHTRQGHTWENFLFTPLNIDRAEFTTLFAVGATNQDLYDRLHAALAHPAAQRAGPDITLGALQIWLWHGNEVRGMYYAMPGGYGTRVTKGVLRALHNNGLF